MKIFRELFNPKNQLLVMSIQDKINAKKAEKVNSAISLARTGLNANYSEQSKEYKAIRAEINQLQKDLRSIFANFAGCFSFDVSKGYFVATKKGIEFFATLSSEEQKELISMFDWIEKSFATKVAKVEIVVKRNYVK